MTYNPELRIPFGYGTAYTSLGELRDWLLVHHHLEYVRRLLAWLSHKGGFIGVGGGFREVQPDKDGFAPEGKSFHQDQHYSDGFVGAAAVDLVVRNGSNVHRAPRWDEVPAQGGAEAKTWGLHCNVPGEPWHMQPIEIDGWQSWKDAGSPAPEKNYPIPGESAPQPIVNPEEDDMSRWIIARTSDTGDRFLASPGPRRGAFHVESEVQRNYPFAASDDGQAFALTANGDGKLVTSWGQVPKIPEASALAYMGKEV